MVASLVFVNIGSGNHFLLDDEKPLSEPIILPSIIYRNLQFNVEMLLTFSESIFGN